MQDTIKHISMMSSIIRKLSKFDTITKPINRTYIPDDVILMILNYNNIPCNTILDLEYITACQIEDYDSFGIRFKLQWRGVPSEFTLDWMIMKDDHNVDYSDLYNPQQTEKNYTTALTKDMIWKFDQNDSIIGEYNRTFLPDDVLMKIVKFYFPYVKSWDFSSFSYNIIEENYIEYYQFKFELKKTKNTIIIRCKIDL